MLLSETETNNNLSATGEHSIMPPGVGDPMHAEKFNVRNLRDPARAFSAKGTCTANPKGERRG